MSAEKDTLFENKGFIHFINRELSMDQEFLEDIATQIDTILEENKDYSLKDKERTFLVKRITDFLLKLYGKFEDEDWQRITEDRCGELLTLLSNSIKREKFYEEDAHQRKEINRYLILKEVEFTNWHLFPSLTINFESSFDVDGKKSNDLKKPKASIVGKNTQNGNIIVFIGRNSEGKSAIFEGIKMGLLGPDKYFLSKSSESEKQHKILELLNKKAIENARTENESHINMEIKITFRIRKENSDTWVDYRITRKWQIALDVENNIDHNIYNTESIYEHLDVLGVGNHKPIDEDSFHIILNQYIPETLQNLFITNKTILTRSLIEEGANFIETTALKSSDFNILEILEKTVLKLTQFLEKEEQDWVLENIKENKDKFEELQKRKEKLQKQIEKAKKDKITARKEKARLQGDVKSKQEIIKDFNQEEADKYIQLKNEANEINDEIQKLARNLNNSIKKTYVDYQFSKLINDAELAILLKKTKKKLPEKPKDTKFSHFSDYTDILNLILESGECLCGEKISKETRQQFDLQTRKNDIEAFHLIRKESIKHLKSTTQVDSRVLTDFQDQYIKIRDLEKKYKKKLREVKKNKPKGLAKKPKKILGEIEKIENKIKKTDNKIANLESSIADIKDELKNIKSEIADITEKLDDPDLEGVKQKFAKQRFHLFLINYFLESAKKRYQIKIQSDVERLITNYFKEIDWEGKFWDGFKIDEEWGIKFVDNRNHSITLPSDGQKKIIMISFICSLIELHRFKIPWLMDNVLSEISDLNIEGFAKQIISNKEFPQQVFFFSITEWGDIKRYLESAVMQAFTFEKLSAIESSIKEIDNMEDLPIDA